MNNKNSLPEIGYSRDKIIWMIIVPQIILLLISMVWISIFPKDNVLEYLKFNPKALFEGIIIGFILAMAGYGFYKFAQKTKKMYETVELFEQILSPTFKILNVFDIFLLSITAALCEEIFFRGLLFLKIGIIFSSIAFGLLHLPSTKYWVYAVWAMLSGALFSWLFMLTGSLWLPISAHATNNIVGMFLLKHVNKKIEGK